MKWPQRGPGEQGSCVIGILWDEPEGGRRKARC